MSAPEPIDLDHNAGTAVDPRVLERFVAVETAQPSNPNSPHAGGRRARAVLEEARAEVAAALGVDADDVIFVASGTEANNLAIHGLGEPGLPVLLAPLEHKSVIEPARRRGLVCWAVDTAGRAVVTAPAAAAGMLSLGHAQGEVGVVQPVAAAGELARELGLPLHVDAAQTLGRLPLDDVLGVADTLSLSVHKAGGLKGCSVLVARRPIAPLLLGGGQEGGRRPGTPSPALAAATALAIRLAIDERALRARAMAAARDAFVTALGQRCTLRAIGAPEHRLPNTIALEFDGIEGRALLPALDLAGLRASQASACASGAAEAPPVLLAMGLDAARARRCARFAFSASTGIARACEAAERVAAVVARLRATRARRGAGRT